MYMCSKSASKVGLGEGAAERGFEGERRPEDIMTASEQVDASTTSRPAATERQARPKGQAMGAKVRRLPCKAVSRGPVRS